MHESSYLRMKCFVKNYCDFLGVNSSIKRRVLDIGSFSVNGSYRDLFPEEKYEYVGADLVEGPNVDVLLDNMYQWDSMEDESFDYVISGQAFEHIEYPWMTMQQIKRVLKNNGVACIIAPNGLGEHRFPLDCWRFYSDGMIALAKWAGLEIIESSVGGVPNLHSSIKYDCVWNDACLVVCKTKEVKQRFKDCIMFESERRYDAYSELVLQYDLLGIWKNNDEYIDEIILKFCGGFNKVVIVGKNYISDALKRLIENNSINTYVISTDEYIQLEFDQDELYIITQMDQYKLLPFECCCKHKSFYIDDLLKKEILKDQIVYLCKKLNNCSDIFIFGAGENAKKITKVLEEHDFSFDGYIVSDDAIISESLQKPIYRISEISNTSGVIISPADKQDIIVLLNKMRFINIFDGDRILNPQKNICFI